MVRRKRLWVGAGLVLVGLLIPSPALAHGGHGSCAQGAQTFTVPLAQSGGLGALASEVAPHGGVAALGEELHAAGCEPRP